MRLSVYEGSLKHECGALQLSYGLEQSDQIYHIRCGAKGDMIKFSKTSGNLVIYEVVLAGTGKDMRVRAVKKTRCPAKARCILMADWTK